MVQKIMNWFSKDDGEPQWQVELPKDETAKFILKVDNIQVGILQCDNGSWLFKYSDEFKSQAKIYNLIVGFPDLDKIYTSDTLWPFFRIRIPGLKQPAIKEIISKEKIDKSNEVELLKRFGKKTISNSYELESA